MSKRRSMIWFGTLALLATLACGLGGGGTPDAEVIPSEVEVEANAEEEVTVAVDEATEEAVAAADSPFTGPVPEGAVKRIGRGRATGMALSPDGAYLAVGTTIGIYLYDRATLQEVWYAPGRGEVWDMVFTPDGSRLVTTQFTRIFVWDTASGEMVGQPIQHATTPAGIAISPDGSTLATAAREAAKLWNLGTGEVTAELIGHTKDVSSVAWTADGTQIVSGSSDDSYSVGELFIWDAASGEIVHQFGEQHTGRVDLIRFSPDGSRLLTTSSDEVILWDFAARSLQTTISRSSIRSAAWSADGAQIAVGFTDGSVRAYDAATGSDLYEASDQNPTIFDVAYSSDSSQLYTLSGAGSVFERDAATGAMLRVVEGFAQGFGEVIWSPDGQTLWAGMSGGLVTHWDVNSLELLHLFDDFGAGGLFDTSAVQAIAYSPDNSLIAIGDLEGRIVLYDPANNTQVAVFGDRETGHKNYIAGLDWSEDGTQIITGSRDETVIIWDVAGQAPLTHFTEFADSSINAIAFLGGDSIGIGVAQNGGIYSFDPASQTATEAWNPDMGILYDMAEHPSNPTQFATANSDGSVVIWDYAAGGDVLTMEEALWHASAVAFSADGSLIAGGDTDGNVALWDAQSGALLMHIEGAHAGFVSAVAFNPDGSLFATVSSDGSILIWASN